ncbi:MAG: hypothetical protein ACUVTP_09650 [Candidatus Fervidibacter sp.]|uniref:hypothetical protein n=1 Tax=Candidatus Fervidibacter sp. TaxID=3100871 RepID=UPI00404B5AEA
MLGRQPKGTAQPDLENYQRLNLPNGEDLALRFCSQPEGTYLVEGVEGFWVMLRKPNSKTPKGKMEYCNFHSDFTVWVLEPGGKLWIPSHLRTLEAFSKLPKPEQTKIFNAIKAVVLEYYEPIDAAQKSDCISQTINGYPVALILGYLKWLAALEDTLFPPPKYLERRMAFAGYVLQSGFYLPEDLKRVLKIFA